MKQLYRTHKFDDGKKYSAPKPPERKAIGCKLSGDERTNDIPENPARTA
jgi:hypothetical protein